MINFKDVKPDDLSMTVRMLREEIIARGWEGWIYYLGSGQVRIKRPDGKVLEIFNSTPPTTSFIAGNIANDKYLTHLLYDDANLPSPETYLASDLQSAQQLAHSLLSKSKKVVVKPLDAAHGHGVSVGVADLDSLEKAYENAKLYSESVLVQEHLEDKVDLRLTCIDHKFVAGLVRLPAQVTGDGQSTVKELINQENKSDRRGEKYRKPLNVINLEKAADYLGEAIHSVPPKGKVVSVIVTANLGTGGETIDITDNTPQWLAELAQNASKVSNLPVCGVDFLVNKQPARQDNQQDLDVKIIEINKCPALFMHETPTFGQARPVIKAYIDYLEAI